MKTPIFDTGFDTKHKSLDSIEKKVDIDLQITLKFVTEGQNGHDY